MKRTITILLLAMAVVLLIGSCATSGDENDPGFNRGDRLRAEIDRRLESGERASALNLVGSGFESGLLTEYERDDYFGRIAGLEYEAARDAYADQNYRAALQHEWNVDVLARYMASLSQEEYRPSDLPSRDEMFLQYALSELDNGEEVIALYLFLRRSALGDLEEGTLVTFLELARRLNHDEAVERIVEVMERAEMAIPAPEDPINASGDSPAEMLGGTVTVWVNRGVRIENGVGLPDRVIGSGFFVDPRGYIMTNYHVVSSEVDPEYEGYSRLYVKLPGRPEERIPARVLGYDRIFDLALLKIERDAEYVFSFSDTRLLEPGEPVLALGSPGGLDSTVTSGIVSAGGRRFLQIGEAMQVDAAINPGNSGGPLVLPDGQVAGVVFAGLEQFEGVNFAIPAYWIRHSVPRLYSSGEIVHGWLGVAVHPTDQGLRVIYVAPGSPADQAGITTGELLRSIEGTQVTTIAEAQDVILASDPGYWVRTIWERAPRSPDVSPIDDNAPEDIPADGESDRQESTQPGVLPTIDVESSQVDTVERLIALGDRPFSPVEEALKQQTIEQLFPVLFGMNVDDISGVPWGPDYVITEVYPGSIADESSLSVDDPFALRDWRVDSDLRAAFIQIIIKKRKAGFLESGMQLGAYLETNLFL